VTGEGDLRQLNSADQSGPYNIDVLARLSAHTDWSAVFNWRKIVFHTPPVTLYILLYGLKVPDKELKVLYHKNLQGVKKKWYQSISLPESYWNGVISEIFI